MLRLELNEARAIEPDEPRVAADPEGSITRLRQISNAAWRTVVPAPRRAHELIDRHDLRGVSRKECDHERGKADQHLGAIEGTGYI